MKRARVILTLAILSSLVTANPALALTPLGKIAYAVSAPGHGAQLWTVDPNGSHRHKVHTVSWFGGPISWSPDGEKIVAAIQGPDGTPTVVVYDRYGRVTHRLPTSTFGDPHWTPDSTAIVLGNYLNGIDQYSLSSRETTRLLESNGRVFDHCPAWTRDMRKLAFAHNEYGTRSYVNVIPSFETSRIPYLGNNYDTGSINPAISLVRRGAAYHDEDLNLQWSPDGKTLVFSTKSNNGTIFVADVSDSGKSIVRRIYPPKGTYLTSYARLSRNGRFLAFGASSGVYRARTHGVARSRLSRMGYSSDVAWSPDGRYIAFAGSANCLYRLDLRTKATRRLAKFGGAYSIDSVDWSPRR